MHQNSLLHIENGLSTSPVYTILLFENFVEITVADVKPDLFSNTKGSETYHWVSFLKITITFKTLCLS